MVHLVANPRIVTGGHHLEGEDWRLCCLCGTTLFYQDKAICSTLERPELLPEALHKAARGWSSCQDKAKVLELIQRGMPVDAEITGETPLTVAARGHLNISRLLMEHGARPEQAIPLVPGRGELAPQWQRLLLKHGCEPQTLLYEVASRASTEAATVVLEAGVDVNLADEDGWIPLYHACGNSASMVRLLLAYNADPRLANADGLHPLHYCAHFGRPQRLKALLQAGVSPNLLDSGEESALLLACAAGHIECAALLVESGADVNLGAKMFTPLMGACRHGSLAIVDLLLEHGADPTARNESGDTARDIAVRYLPGLLLHVIKGKENLQHRWSTNAAGERCLKVRHKGRTTTWADGHLAIVERLS